MDGSRNEDCLDPSQTGLAPGVPHLANRPLGVLQRTGFVGAGVGHLTNLPLTSRQGFAASADVPASIAIETAAIANFLNINLSQTKIPAGPSLCQSTMRASVSDNNFAAGLMRPSLSLMCGICQSNTTRISPAHVSILPRRSDRIFKMRRRPELIALALTRIPPGHFTEPDIRHRPRSQPWNLGLQKTAQFGRRIRFAVVRSFNRTESSRYP